MSTTVTENVITLPQQVSVSTSDAQPYDYANLKPYVHPAETKEQLPWSELVTLDLSDFNQPGGKERLAKQLEHAVHHVGFFYVKNFGLSQEEVDRQFTLARNAFDLPTEEKEKYIADFANGAYNGYRRPGQYAVGTVPDNIEVYNFAKFTDDFKHQEEHLPDVLKAHLPEIAAFHRALHANVVLPLLRLFAIVLQLPDDEYLAKQHTYEKHSEDHMRYMLYRKRTAEEHAASNQQLTPGHTDLGTLTLLFRQPVIGLQILGEDGKWTYVSSQPGTITVNLADTISHLTGGYLKSSVHRVVAPPADQIQYDRQGIVYFARPHSDLILNPILDSPVLQAAGVKPRFTRPVSMAEWVKAKQALQLNPDLRKKKYEESGDGTVEVLEGFRDRNYD
ncbi:putative oxidoreductase [Mytilinidion resinicola]|uniref:Oxidoreductase n=1 Tax=Mytilinidion resinicola TaxID=574789 RepID=A0A6A6YQX4_9PEZI|nr:putative oxidoreductase [Mytilinidion resinicola]KAF2811302.1 putative oxidoreductase [Mytilinidion resinicola]